MQAGRIRVLGQELAGADTRTLETVRRRLGFIFQAHNLHESLTARQNVLMALQVHGRGDLDRQSMAAEHVLGLVGLEHRGNEGRMPRPLGDSAEWIPAPDDPMPAPHRLT